jgi:hypothetical protein
VEDFLAYEDEEGYEDYGQYGAEEGGYEGTLVDADGNKGGDKLLYEYIVRDPVSGPRSHKCTLCGKTSTDRSNLRKHVESIHFPGIYSYDCKYCHEIFTTRNFLNLHIKTHKMASM